MIIARVIFLLVFSHFLMALESSPSGVPIPTLACIVVRYLIANTDYVAHLEKEQIPASMIPCLKEVIVRESIKPYLFPLTLNKSKNTDSVHHNGVCGLGFINTDNKLVSLACDGKLAFFDGQQVMAANAYLLNRHMSSLSISDTEPVQIFLGSLDGHVCTMDYKTKTLTRDIGAHTGDVTHLAHTEEYVASCSNDKTVKIWDRASGNKLVEFGNYGQSVRVVEFLDKNILASGSSDGCIKLLDAQEEHVKACHQYEGAPRIWAMDRVKRNPRIIAGLNDGRISLLDANKWKEISQWYAHDGLINSLAANQDEKTFVSGSWDALAKVWDMRMRSCVAILSAHNDWVQRVSILDSGNEIITGSRDHSLRVWDMRMFRVLEQSSLAKLLTLAKQDVTQWPVTNDGKIACLKSLMSP